MDPDLRARVRRFHTGVTLAAGFLFAAAGAAAAYITFFYRGGIPPWLTALARWFAR